MPPESPSNNTTEWCAGLPLVLQRTIDEKERSELHLAARRLRRFGIGVVGLFPLLVGLFILAVAKADSTLVKGNLESRGDWVSFLILTAVTVWTDVQLARALWQARLLGQDAREGRVVILRVDEETTAVRQDRASKAPSGDGAPAGNGKPGAMPEGVELLPISRWDWTEDGAPAAWRLVRP